MTDDFTPATQDVRFSYADRESSVGYDYELAMADFDRWLAEERAAIWDACAGSIKYESGEPVEVVYVINPYRQARSSSAKGDES